MAKTSAVQTVPVATNVAPASTVFTDLFSTIDGAFDRYVKYDQYQLNKKTVSALQDQTSALKQLAQSQYDDPSVTSAGDNQMMTLVVIGAIAVIGVMLLAKG